MPLFPWVCRARNVWIVPEAPNITRDTAWGREQPEQLQERGAIAGTTTLQRQHILQWFLRTGDRVVSSILFLLLCCQVYNILIKGFTLSLLRFILVFTIHLIIFQEVKMSKTVCTSFFFLHVSIRSVLTDDGNQFPWINVSRGRLLNITCPVDFKPAVIRWPKIVNALAATFLRGAIALWEVRQGWAGQCWSCLGLQSEWMCTTFHAKMNDLLWYCLRWNVKQPDEVCVGGKKYKV